MISFAGYAKEQYEFIRESRNVLFAYCQTLTPHAFLIENNSFGKGSIRNLLVHVANTYEFWISNVGLNKNLVFAEYDSKQNVGDIVELYGTIDIIVFDFLEAVQKNGIEKIAYELNGIQNSVHPFKLFAHVITHEFHHKGQILSLSRHLGYTPVDTDIIR